MKILLFGEYSNVHWTLAEGLRAIGHDVTVISNGDFWKDYNRDISLVRSTRRTGGMTYACKLLSLLPKLRGYDVVQLINPMFLEIRAKYILPVYRYLRKHNKSVLLCGFGMDYYWVNTCTTKMPLRYSDFNIGKKLRTNADAIKEVKDWIGTDKETLNRTIAEDCDGIVTGLYEYWCCYAPSFQEKTTYIPFPIRCDFETNLNALEQRYDTSRKVRIFIGINKTRHEYKGTDIMLHAAEAVERAYPQQMELIRAESLPFAQYTEIMNGSDAILDQLYSYTPAMNSLEAMSRGIICIGGGEPENYDILGEQDLHPIINVEPDHESVVRALTHMVSHPEEIPTLKRESIEYVRKHHDYIKVARQYEAFYQAVLQRKSEGRTTLTTD